jgi:nitronate monooxygenase
MIVESKAADIVYSNLFTGVHGNYLKGSVRARAWTPTICPNPIPPR